MSKKTILPNYEDYKIYAESHSRHEISNHFNISKSKVDRLRIELNIPRKTFQYKNIDLNFTSEQINIINGSMLGDGSLSLVGRQGQKNSKYIEVHSENQIEWLEWKKEKLNPLQCKLTKTITNGRKRENNKIINDPTKKLKSCKLVSIVNPFFTTLEKKWYLRDKNGDYILEKNKRIKTVPDDLILTPITIAVWFFDDGSNSPKNRQAVFNTHSFSYIECEKLTNKLKLFGINCGVVKNSDKFIIQTKTSSYLDLINLIANTIFCKCLQYKVDLSEYKPPDYSTRFYSKGKTYRQI